jgi:DNA integrity scanning protein DisA with diadenylate cyclase activity
MSTLETFTREEILAAITLSEEDGRMTIFTNWVFNNHSDKELAEE